MISAFQKAAPRARNHHAGYFFSRGLAVYPGAKSRDQTCFDCRADHSGRSRAKPARKAPRRLRWQHRKCAPPNGDREKPPTVDDPIRLRADARNQYAAQHIVGNCAQRLSSRGMVPTDCLSRSAQCQSLDFGSGRQKSSSSKSRLSTTHALRAISFAEASSAPDPS
jgi:hypothetical protein